MKVSSKRARQVAIIGFVLSVLFFIAVFVIGGFNGSPAVLSLSWQILGGGLIWFVLVLQFHQRSLAEQEKLDIAQLAQAKRSETIFQADAERGQMFAVAEHRLKILEKWFLPAFAIIIAAYQITLGWLLLGTIKEGAERVLSHDYLAAVLTVAVAFVSFLLSRYATGMSAQAEWKPLRAGGSYLLSSTVLAFLVTIGLTLYHFKLGLMIYVMSWVIPILMIVLGAETALNVLLDIYRPRMAGQYSRSAFDSRLLGMVSEPGGILNTVASAIDYQFGFKVSQTWFYKLLEEAILPLILFSIVTLYLLSCLVVIEPGQQALIERLGSYHRVAGPGLTLKWPWPFAVARIYDTERVQQLNIGFTVDESKADSREPLLWGEKHYKEEDHLLVAAHSETSDGKGGAPVSLVVAAVPVQYRIKNLKDYVYNHADAREMLRVICYRELVKYAASAKVETQGDEGAGDRKSIFGAGRETAAAYLTQQISRAADAAGLGVEIVYLGLEGVHPPADEGVAKTYQEVIGAIQKKYAAVMEAQAEQNRILITLAGGDAERANELYKLARQYQQASEAAKEAENPAEAQAVADAVGEELNAAIRASSGDIFQTLSEATSDAFEKVILAEATGKRYEGQLKAYKAAKTIYPREVRLAMLEETLKGARKYVVLAEDADTEVYIVDLQQEHTPDLYDLNLEAIEAIQKNK